VAAELSDFFWRGGGGGGGAWEVYFVLSLLFNPLNPELNFICHLITFRGGVRYLGFSRLRVNKRTRLEKKIIKIIFRKDVRKDTMGIYLITVPFLDSQDRVSILLSDKNFV
jgi:hypothetical protein